MMTKGNQVFLLTIFILCVFLLPAQISAVTKTASTEVSVSIGEYEFFLFGYGSPNSLITIEGVGVFDQTYSNSKGYFEFKNRFSPFSTREPCLQARDQLGRVSQNVCIPPFPVDRSVTIGPIILPPTVYLNKSTYFVGDQIILSGQTIPNTDVNLSFFIDQYRSPVTLVKSAHAVSLPKLSTKADSKGNYSISLPSSQADYFRVFAQDIFNKQDSPKSNTLAVKVLPWWMIFVEFLLLLWDLLRSRFLEVLIISQILALLWYLLHKYLKPHVIAKNRALTIRENSLLLTEHELVRKN